MYQPNRWFDKTNQLNLTLTLRNSFKTDTHTYAYTTTIKNTLPHQQRQKSSSSSQILLKTNAVCATTINLPLVIEKRCSCCALIDSHNDRFVARGVDSINVTSLLLLLLLENDRMCVRTHYDTVFSGWVFGNWIKHHSSSIYSSWLFPLIETFE